MTPTVEHALAKFQNAPKERKEKVAQMILVELEDVRDDYDRFVETELDLAAADIKAGRIKPIEDVFSNLYARFEENHGAA